MTIEKKLLAGLMTPEKHDYELIDILELEDFENYYDQQIIKSLKKIEKSEINIFSVIRESGLDSSRVAEDYQVSLDSNYVLAKELIALSVIRRIKKTNDAKEIKRLLARNDYFLEKKVETSSLKFLLDSFEEEKSKVGFNTGFFKLDQKTKRLKKKHLWIIGGYSNTGKSQFAVQMCMSAIDDGASILFLTMEMPEDDMMQRFWKYRRRNSSEDDSINYFTKNEKNLSITSEIYKLQEIEKIDLSEVDILVIDFIQLVKANGNSRREELENIARNLQIMAKQTDTCIVALSQVNEEFGKTKGNQVMGFKGSGDIGNAADVGIILQRYFDVEGNNDIVDFDLVLRKNRHGMTGLIKLQFDKNSGFII